MNTRSRASVRALQGAVSLAGLVPVSAGVAGVILGLGLADSPPGGIGMAGAATAVAGAPALDSHVRYLSGLLLAIGVAFWSLVPGIEARGPAFRMLTAIVVAGGLARLFGLLAIGVPPPAMLAGLAMELVVTPLLCLWQAAVARPPSP